MRRLAVVLILLGAITLVSCGSATGSELTITSVTPMVATRGQTIMVMGTGLGSAAAVLTIGGAAADEVLDGLIALSDRTRGVEHIDDEALWIRTEEMTRNALTTAGIHFVEAEDEAAFYGPKIDVQIRSAIGREFTLATNQVDFAVPARMGLHYIDQHGERRVPLCLHRAPLSTHERLIGFLIEHFAGDFPLWLAPEQVRIVPIADRHNAHAQALKGRLEAAGLRASADTRSERMNAKVRDAELYKVPYTVILGDKETETGLLSYRSRKETDRNEVSTDAFIAHLVQAVKARSLTMEPLAVVTA